MRENRIARVSIGGGRAHAQIPNSIFANPQGILGNV